MAHFVIRVLSGADPVVDARVLASGSKDFVGHTGHDGRVAWEVPDGWGPCLMMVKVTHSSGQMGGAPFECDTDSELPINI